MKFKEALSITRSLCPITERDLILILHELGAIKIEDFEESLSKQERLKLNNARKVSALE